VKLGTLLAVGFGEAGALIIGANLKGDQSAGVQPETMGGRIVEAVFGYCTVGHFEEVTQALSAKITTFVNLIGGLVHNVVNEFSGHPTKNVGHGFFFVWYTQDRMYLAHTAELAVLSFARALALIHRSALLAEYRTHPAILERVPKYRVSLGFGLHFGKAIEGAIGSEYKIDASYLGPDINLSMLLVDACWGELDAPLILSNDLVECCSEGFASELRLVDCAKFRGSKRPLRLFICDLDYEALEVDHNPTKKIRNQFRRRQMQEIKRQEKWVDSFVPMAFLFEDPDISKMRAKFSRSFFDIFEMAYLNYVEGEWAVAKMFLERAISTLGAEDGPSRALLRFMGSYGFEAPKHWQGHRVIGESQSSGGGRPQKSLSFAKQIS